MSEPHRSVVILREIQGLSYREIGDALEMPLSTVRVSLHRGRRRLREELREVRDHVEA
jgi:RNA polymerase sigma-70 factor (ECF subfamily)